MRRLITLALIALSSVSALRAQSIAAKPDAAQTLQSSQSEAPVLLIRNPAEFPQADVPALPGEQRELKIPSGTPIEVEAVYTVSSQNMKVGELLSFRVLVPVMIDGIKVVESGALVTARVTMSKRGGHWGRAGKLAWRMEDVVGVDTTRIPLAPETRVRVDPMWSLDTKGGKTVDQTKDQGRVVGVSHGGEVATKTIVTAAIVPFLAPIALMQGFRRGENAILAEGKRFVVLVRADSKVKAVTTNR
jgi:hypothetical protein